MTRYLLVLLLPLLMGCEPRAIHPPPYHSGRAVESREMYGYTITSFTDGTVEFANSSPILGFSMEAGMMHDLSLAIEEVSFNAIKRGLPLSDHRPAPQPEN